MDDTKNTTQTSSNGTKKNNNWDLKQYMLIALIVFVTFCCCTLFFFMIYRYNGFADFWRKLVVILQPITIGLVLAYLLNPIMKFFEKYLLKLFGKHMKSQEKVKKTARGIAVAGALLFLVGIIVLLIAAVVPSITKSIQNMTSAFPQEVNNTIIPTKNSNAPATAIPLAVFLTFS